ncbi:uncharacterized protein ColSpa_03765 [Colletotrichum spaethianum]|uniref:LysM domain-containing protein n=1 Tax=Colletotrichum spaethianum TaxID=700344 RepID=A0AA37LA92_9PEZI|nr:uncharacterized protein ColSpa_03765 [Colletotrichum spaethianum]GKT43584.1 hypothetical protein ColSpa_03765 [Colletotrichum spaethianum]
MQFLSWNHNIQGSCSGIATGQRISCDVPGTHTDAGGSLLNKSPGGTAPKPNATITALGATGSPTYYETATPANPTQSGTISQCGAYYLVAPGDDCFTVNQRFNLAAGRLWE